MEENKEPEPQTSKSQEGPEFKKPVLIGKIGKLPKKATKSTSDTQENKNDTKAKPHELPPEKPKAIKANLTPAQLLKEMSTPIPYKEPKWSGLCPDGTDYGLEVLKSGMIVENVDLTTKQYMVFGRLANCDVVLAHPTISRYHAVLQYKAVAEDGEHPCGWYLYDLGSTHGTFLNRDRVNPNHYTRVRVGHQIKFGSSSRTYIVTGPDFDSEGESELSVTEIKQRAQDMKRERERMIQEAIEKRETDRLEEEKRKEEQGIDWGMGEDAEEEPDLAENPYASTGNEELYLDDPKKTLRGYFEREGHELTYDCEERGQGQFLCRVELPMDDASGRPIIAEVLHKGKKKEAVIACALEACRILDRAGVLRQAKHESRKKKQRDWSADDYYDSDDDNYLDRTGAVERKRDARIKKYGKSEKEDDKPMTYDGLLKQITDIESQIAQEEKVLSRLRETSRAKETQDTEVDSLDSYMDSLGKQGQSMAQKAEISNTKLRIQKLKTELTKTQRLADIARPAHLPPLVKKSENNMAAAAVKIGANSVVYGKRIRLKEDQERKPKVRETKKKTEEDFVEEVDSDEEIMTTEEKRKEDSTERETEKRKTPTKSEKDVTSASEGDSKRVFGPMRPPENYVIPESYYNQTTDRDLPEIMEDE